MNKVATVPNRLPRRYMRAALRQIGRLDAAGLRSPELADAPALASLMLHAYTGTIDYEGESEADALVQIHKTISGESGAFLWPCSKVIERNGLLASASLITRWQETPFVAFTMTRPEFKRQGLARACMVSAMQDLLSLGEHELRLVVTLANTEAVSLYQSLGFAVEE